MKDQKNTFNVIVSVEKHIEALKPLLPKQAIVCIGEYPIKILLKEPGMSMSKTDKILPILIEKSSDDIYNWLPKGFSPYLILGFEDVKIDTHFWYNVLPYISRDETILENLKKKALEKLHGATIVASIWDGIGSAFLPELMLKFKFSKVNSLAIAVLPSNVQPGDAHFNAYAAVKRSQTIEGATVLLTDRDHLDSYEGVDRKGLPLKGNVITNYLVDLLLAKDTLVEEISELSRTFNVGMYTLLLVTGASYKIYGSLENMLNTALLKTFLTFDLSTSSLLYVLLRMPLNLKDKLPRAKIELAIANWFKDKATLQSIYITEPIYTEDTSDRIDAVLFVGGFDTNLMFAEYEMKSKLLKDHSVEKGYMTEDWQLVPKPEPIEERIVVEEPKAPPPPETPTTVEPPTIETPQTVEPPRAVTEPEVKVSAEDAAKPENAIGTKIEETPASTEAAIKDAQTTLEEAKPASKLRRLRRIRKSNATKS
jgi:hypothetical protein